MVKRKNPRKNIKKSLQFIEYNTHEGGYKMINSILQLIPILVLAGLSAYFSYQMDRRFRYVKKINKRFAFSENQSIGFFIGLMAVAMVIIPLVTLKIFNATKETAYILSSMIVGFCCYSSTDCTGILERTDNK